jgi:hypothetical protein
VLAVSGIVEDGSWAFATAQAKTELKMARKMILFIGKTSIVKKLWYH